MYQEQVWLGQGFLLEVVFVSHAEWKLSLRKGKKLLVQYSNDGPYEFKSVEKLRYDFERDVENAKRQDR